MKFYTKILVLVLFHCLILTACSGNSGNQEKDLNSTGVISASTESMQSNTNTASKVYAQKEPKDYSGTITMWTYDLNTDTAMAAEFNKAYPNIKIKIVPISEESDYITKLSSAMVSGDGIPDVVTLEYNILGKFINTDQFEALGDAPYNGNQFKTDMVEYMFDMGRNLKGLQIGMPVDPAPAGLFYRKDIVKQYLGTDDPEKLSKMMPDWDSFLEAVRPIKERSGGKVYALPYTNDIFRLIREQTEKKWIDDNKKVTIETVYLDAAKQIEKMVKAGLFANLKSWDAPWFASFSQGNVAFYPDGLWLEGFVIKQADADGAGRWGVAKLPGGCVNRGGVNLAIPKGSMNKEIAWQFVKWYTTTEEASIMTRKLTGGLTSYKPAYKNPIYHEGDPFMGGFKTTEFFINEANTNMKVLPVSPYDIIMNDAIDKYISPFEEGRITSRELLRKVTDEVLQKIPGSSR